ncbi:MAG: aromatic ring-hydroxylating dioxygenase subunit alpha [Parvibaculaceae bacterium]|nr:aromatic ring-hydroxylating dioxygenase subunit alpha [Parvibaculaceae bacterium]
MPQISRAWDEQDAEEAYSLPAHFFYDQKIFDAEKKDIFFKSWHMIGHESELATPGSFLTQDIFEQSVIATRDRDGKIYAFHNVCQHRGNRLVEERRGKFSPALVRCAYHAWAYSMDGALQAAPRTECLKNFNKADYGLKPVRVENYGGFVFVNLDSDAQSVADMVPGALDEMRRFLPDLDRLRLIEEVDVIVDANWKVIQENSIEGYHFDLSGPVHKELAALIDYSGYDLTSHDNWWTYIGPPAKGETTHAYGVEIGNATYQTPWFFNIGLWPNTTFYSFPYTDMIGTFIMIPLDPERSLLRFGYYGIEGRELPELTQAAIRWMNTQLGPEDIQLNVSNQKGLHSFGFTHGRYLIDAERSSYSEHLVHHFHKLCYQAIRGAEHGA